MENPPSIKEFVQALTLLSAPSSGLTDDLKVVYECLLCPSNMTEIVPIVRLFCDGFFDTQLYRHFLDYVVDNADRFLESEKRFLEVMIPRCLTLCDAPKPFFLILTCSFMVQILYTMIGRFGCYRFAVTASKCISAIIERKFKFFFDDKNQWKVLCLYSENVMETFYAMEEEMCIVDFLLSKGKLKDYILNLIVKSTAKIDIEFALSDYELALLSEEDTIEVNLEKNAKLPKTKDILNETISKPSFEEKYAGCVFDNHEEYKKKVIYAEALEQDPGRFLQGPCFKKLHDWVCVLCGRKCFEFLVLCIQTHRNRYGDERTVADAWLELYSDE